jgi:putative transposase
LDRVFGLNLRDLELSLADRGIVVFDETVRRWCKKFAARFAGRLRRRRPQSGENGIWHQQACSPR